MPFQPSTATPFKAKLSVAPMMAWTDKHCRYFHRLITKNTLLYTEMVNAGAVIYGGTARHLDFNAEEHPVALQLGGNEPDKLAQATRFAEEWGYDEVNLNCGCPSPRVQKGAFGAALMAEPNLVADCVKAMLDVVKDVNKTPITVKHRIGLDKSEDTPQSYAFVRDFMGAVADAGCQTFIVHARNAWLEGLSPKENRDIPPLRYEVVHQLKRDFPQLNIVINGGIADFETIDAQLQHVDGVMVGRQAYHDPYWLAQVDARVFAGTAELPSRRAVLDRLMAYAEAQMSLGVPLRNMARHWLNLYHGVAGARAWRRNLSDAKLLNTQDVRVLLMDVPNEA